MLRSKARADERSGYFGDDAPVDGIHGIHDATVAGIPDDHVIC